MKYCSQDSGDNAAWGGGAISLKYLKVLKIAVIPTLWFIIPLLAPISQYYVLAYNDSTMTYIVLSLIVTSIIVFSYRSRIISMDGRLEGLVTHIVLTYSILLMHTSSFAVGLYGVDVYNEYRYSLNVLKSGFSALSSDQATSSFGPLVIPAIISMITSIRLVDFYRAFLPLLLATVSIPLILVYRKMLEDDALLRSYNIPQGMTYLLPLFIVFTTTYIHTLLSAPRQGLALLLYTYMLYSFLELHEKKSIKFVFTTSLLSVALVLYHYSTFFLYIAFILTLIFVELLIRVLGIKHGKSYFDVFMLIIFIISIIFGSLWYVYTPVVAGITASVKFAIKRLLTLESILEYASPIIPVKQYYIDIRSFINLAINGVLVLGYLHYMISMLRRKHHDTAGEDLSSYFSLFTSSFILLALTLLLSSWISKYGIGRAYIQFLITAVPLVVLAIPSQISNKINTTILAKFLLTTLIIFSLFNSTYLTEALQGVYQSSIYDRLAYMRGYMGVYTQDLDVVNYIFIYSLNSHVVITDYFGENVFKLRGELSNLTTIHNELNGIYSYGHAIVILRYYNIASKIIFSYTTGIISLNVYLNKLTSFNLIYNNGACVFAF
jgi:hypothetical protein